MGPNTVPYQFQILTEDGGTTSADADPRVPGIEQTSVQPHCGENLLRGLLQVIGGEDVRWLREQAGCRVEIEPAEWTSFAIGLFVVKKLDMSTRPAKIDAWMLPNSSCP